MNNPTNPTRKGLGETSVDELMVRVEERVSDWHGRHLIEMSRALLKVSLATEFDALSTQQQEQLAREVRDLRRHPRMHTTAALATFWNNVARLSPPPSGRTWGTALAQDLWTYNVPVLAAFEAGGIDPHIVAMRMDQALATLPRGIDWEAEVSALVHEIQSNVQAMMILKKEAAERERAEYLARIYARIDELLGD